MTQPTRTVADLTVEEFTQLLRQTIQETQESSVTQPVTRPLPLQGLLDIKPIDLGALNPPDALIRREDYYDDER